jgi:hypothetical protein
MESTAIEERRSIVGRSAYQPLVVVLAAAAAGIVLDRVSVVPLAGWLALAWAAWGVWACLWRRQNRWSAWLLLLAIAGAAGAWHHFRWYLFATERAEPVCLEGRALGSPRRIPPPPFDPMRTLRAGERSRLDLEVLRIRDG